MFNSAPRSTIHQTVAGSLGLLMLLVLTFFWPDIVISIRSGEAGVRLVPKLHQQVGPGYVDTVVVPEVDTAVRTVIGRFRPDELYAATVDEIQNDVVLLARRQVRNRFVLVDDVNIRTIVLPPTVAAAIQRTLEQEQMSLEMQYRLTRERQEADRKRIEAGGIRDYLMCPG